MDSKKKIECEETKRYAISLIRRGESTSYIMSVTGLSEGTISKYRGQLGMGNRTKEIPENTKILPKNFCDEWSKWTSVIRNAYRSGMIRTRIALVPEPTQRELMRSE